MSRLHHASFLALSALASVALLTVLWGSGQPPQADEGTLAHVFQLSVALMAPAGLVFLATLDRQRPLASARGLLFPTIVLLLAFIALYRLEHPN